MKNLNLTLDKIAAIYFAAITILLIVAIFVNL